MHDFLWKDSVALTGVSEKSDFSDRKLKVSWQKFLILGEEPEVPQQSNLHKVSGVVSERVLSRIHVG